MIADRPMLSLAELELHDPRPAGHSSERRFLCPLPACADHQRRGHKNLAANIETGLWACKRCGASGRLTERWERREPRARALRLGPYEKARRAMGLASNSAGLAPVHRGVFSPRLHAPTAAPGAFKTVLLAHDNDETDVYGQRVGDMAVDGLIPPLRSYGAEPERPENSARSLAARSCGCLLPSTAGREEDA